MTHSAPPGPKSGGRSGPVPVGPVRPAQPAPVVAIRPKAGLAQVKRRHRGLLVSFLVLVALPLAAMILYLWLVATDQYASTVGFTVRKQEGVGATDLMGGLAQFTGASASSEADILYEFIQSQEIVQAIDARVDLARLYAGPWPKDPVFSFRSGASIEDLVRHWQRMVKISYDQATGLIEVQALAFSAPAAQLVATEIIRESQNKINDMNASARADVMRHAEADLVASVARLKAAREALTRFRTRTQIVDPAADIQGRMGVLNNLQQQLAQALIEYDILQESAAPGDPRLAQGQRRIEVIRARIMDERQTFTGPSDAPGSLAGDYPTLIADYEGLTVDREFAEETYRAALAAVELARSDAARQSLYLAAYIRPTLPETSEFPRRFVLTGVAALILSMIWAIGALVYYSLRDRQ